MKLGSYLPSPVLTQEAIAYQRNNPAGPEFELLFASYKEMVDAGYSRDKIEARHDLRRNFNALCRKHFGVNAVLVTNSMLAATIPNVYSVMSPAIRSQMYAFYDTMRLGGVASMAALPDAKDLGKVDTANAKLTGWFSEQETQLFLNFTDLFNYGLSIAEVTAVALHEIGHNFEGAASSNISNSVNLVLSDVTRHILDKKRGADKNYVFRELKTIDNDLTQDTVDGLMSGQPTVMGVAAFRLAKGVITNLNGSRISADTSFESISDSFATRLGYGEHLATGLEKMSASNRYITVFARVMELFVLYGAVAYLISLLRVVLQTSLNGKLLMTVLGAAFTVATIIQRNRISIEDKVYDDEKDRITRIKHDVINSLKDPGISNAIRRQTLEQLEVIAKVESLAVNIPKPLQQLMNVVIAEDKRTVRGLKAQQEFEKLIANDIFVSANKLLDIAGSR